MRLAVGTDPTQSRARAACAHEQWEGHPKYMLASRMAAALQWNLSLYSNLHFLIRPCPCRPCCYVCPPFTQKASAELVGWNKCECGNLSCGGAVPSHSKDHTHRISWHKSRERASENRKEDAARMSAGSLHEIAHTMEHVFNMSHFLLSSSALLFSDKSWDLSQLPHLSLFRHVCHCHLQSARNVL